MRTARAGYDNYVWSDGATFAASSEALGYPVGNLAGPEVWGKWRSATDVTDQLFSIDWLVNKTIKLVALKNYKGFPGGNIKAEYYDGAWHNFGGGTGVFTQPAVNVTGVIALFYPTGHVGSRIRISFLNPGPAGYAECGICYAGSYFEPTISIAPGYGLRRVENTTIQKSTGGSRSADRKSAYWQIVGAQFEFEPETDRDAFLAFTEYVGIHRPFMFAIDPDTPGKFMFYGYLDESIEYRHVNPGFFGLPFTFSEAV